MSEPSDTERLWSSVRDALDRGVFAKLTLGDPDGQEPELRKLVARPVSLRGGLQLQLVWSRTARDTTKNQPIDEAMATLRASFPSPFRSVHLATTEQTLQLTMRRGVPRLFVGPAAHAQPADRAHDRRKNRPLEPDPRWFDQLAPRKGAAEKRRQVYRFIEILDHWLSKVERPADGVMRWVDVGCGSGALTFAAWEYLRRSGFHAATVTGVELRAELAAKTERLARQLNCEGLSFRQGAIADLALPAIDGIIALHACDTATDDALAAGVRAGARWLLAAPCCHRELRPKLAPPDALSAILDHGILKTREAEIATDALRAALLGAVGFDARVFEFISTEHTDKNLMIAATRAREAHPDALVRAQQLARFYGIDRQHLATRLGLPL